VLDPQVQFGEPIIANSRLTTELVAAVAQSLGVESAADRFRISNIDVESAMKFESSLAKALN
jgi:uncharacterized protein (DUF433 family)